jgi:hypothetical protein
MKFRTSKEDWQDWRSHGAVTRALRSGVLGKAMFCQRCGALYMDKRPPGARSEYRRGPDRQGCARVRLGRPKKFPRQLLRRRRNARLDRADNDGWRLALLPPVLTLDDHGGAGQLI